MMNSIVVSIVIVSYNSKKYLMNCLESIFSSKTNLDYEIIVVDNASIDNTFLDLHNKYNSVKFIYNEINNGFASANNQGIEIASGKYILLLNPDTLIKDGSIDVMANYLSSNSKAGACGCKVFNEDGSLQPSFFGFPTLIKEFGHLLRISRIKWLYGIVKSSNLLNKIARTNFGFLNNTDSIVEVDYLLGACLMIKASVLDKVGPLDRKIFMYIEDTEMCYRIKANGYGVYYIPHGSIVHYGGKSSATVDHRMLKEYNRSRLYFYRKCYGSFKTYVLKAIIFTDMLFKMMAIWFVKYQPEMQLLQLRYADSSQKQEEKSYVTTLPSRVKSFKLYGSIIKMTITY